jgi:hypothetical protein
MLQDWTEEVPSEGEGSYELISGAIFPRGTMPNLAAAGMEVGARAVAYNSAGCDDLIWEHEPPSSSREATVRPSISARGAFVQNFQHVDGK